MPKHFFASSEKNSFSIETEKVSKFCMLSIFLRVISVAHFQNFSIPLFSLLVIISHFNFFLSNVWAAFFFSTDSKYILFLSFNSTLFSYSFHCFLPYCWTISIWNVFLHVLVFSLKKDHHSNGSILLPVFVMHHLSLPSSTHPFPLRFFLSILDKFLAFHFFLCWPLICLCSLLKKSYFPCSYLTCHCLPFCVQDSVSPFSLKLLHYHHSVIKSI